MPLTSKWGSSATTVSRIDWTCDSNDTKPRPLNHSCTFGAACPPLNGPTGISASVLAPASGPTGTSASVLAPANGPTGISASVAANTPASGPTGISAAIAQFNIAPIVSNQVTLVATTPPDGTIVNSSDTGALYVYDATGAQWHHIKQD